MKWTTVICTECNNPIEVGGHNAELPYVCVGCKQEAEEFQEKIAPAAGSTARTACGRTSQTVQAESEQGDPGDEHQGCSEVTEDDIAATNELIADLTEENATLREASAQADRLIEDQADALKRANDLLVEGVEKLESAEEFVKAMTRSRNVYRESYFRVANSRKLYQRKFFYAEREAAYYRSRGFWARLINRPYVG